MAMKKKWYQQGSFWTGIAAIVGGVGGLVTGQVDVQTGVQTIVGGFAVIFIRRAIEEAK
jgi:hypothetical protein